MTPTTPARPATRQEASSPSQAPLGAIFSPRNVAVIGSTDKPGSVGRTITWNLISSPFGGTVFPVNPKRSAVLGVKAYPTIAAVPDPVDLAVIVTPAASVPGIMEECVAARVSGAIIISAGFREMGEEGAALEQRVRDSARKGGMRVVGPNCLGVMNPTTGLNATFARGIARKGSVAFISQSGALCTAILDWSLKEMVGFSAFASVGSMLDVGWGDLIDYLGDDPNTSSILIYMESIGDARAFISSAREVALEKPIIVIKPGRTEQAARAAVSHTGSMVGSDAALDAAFRRSGVLRVERISDLFSMAEVLAKQPRPKGKRLTIVTNAGGPAVLATDALIQSGGLLTELSAESRQRLDGFLPPHWSRNNPIDILGDAGPDRYAKAIEVAAADPGSDGILVILTPQDMTAPTETARQLGAAPRPKGKPVLASWMGESEVAEGVAVLNGAGIPTFPYPDTAVKAFNYMWRHAHDLEALYETPAFKAARKAFGEPDRAAVEAMLTAVRTSGRTVLTEVESKRLLLAYGLPTVEAEVAASPAEAVRIAVAMGFPVVLKVHSETLTHKTDVGGVRLDLGSEEAVREAYRAIEESVAERAGAEHFLGVTVQRMVTFEGYELILGCTLDSQFGPVILFGAGGQLVELLGDRSLGLPPLNTTLARRMMETTRIYRVLQGVRGRKPVDLSTLEHIISRFSQLVVEQPVIREIDINPLRAGADGIVALDSRVVLHPSSTPLEALPRTAIRPYPTSYVFQRKLKDGTSLTIRPVRGEDEPLIVRFHQSLSEQTVELRYLHAMNLVQRIDHKRMIRVCFVDYDRQMALVADHETPETGEHEILGVARLSRLRRREEAEFAIVVRDQWQGRGLGQLLLGSLLEVGRAEGIGRITGLIHPENGGMRRLCERLGFAIHPLPADPGLLEAVYVP